MWQQDLARELEENRQMWEDRLPSEEQRYREAMDKWKQVHGKPGDTTASDRILCHLPLGIKISFLSGERKQARRIKKDLDKAMEKGVGTIDAYELQRVEDILARAEEPKPEPPPAFDADEEMHKVGNRR